MRSPLRLVAQYSGSPDYAASCVTAAGTAPKAARIAVAGEIDAMGVVYKAVEGGVGISRVADKGEPFIDGDLAVTVSVDTLSALRHELLDRKITEHHGRIVKTTGDGMLVVHHGSRPGLSRCGRADARQLRQRARDCCSRLDAPPQSA
jgi:hypothetical protein